ncbi:hypothetical protein M569_03915, partial [Genlisea aurea]
EDEGTENENSDSDNYEKTDESENDDADAVAEKDEEMEELENEYKKLKDEEQNIFRNLKQHTEEDIQKGQAVKNQRALWDKTLEFRFLLQKPFSNSNRLPLEPVRSLFCELENEVSKAYSDLITSSEKTLDAILELQQALLANNPQIMSSGEDTKRMAAEPSCSSNDDDTDEEWSKVLEIQSRMASFRNASIDKWQRKTLVATGAAAIKDKLHAFNQSTSQQVASYMRDPSKMVKGMQQNRSSVAVFGNVPNSNENANPLEECYPDGDPELVDDSDFYQQLLKEFIESIDPSSSETAYYALKRFQSKKRKVVDRRASKSRKIRYHVHEKLVNFMAPRRMDLPPVAAQLFASLFGGK